MIAPLSCQSSAVMLSSRVSGGSRNNVIFHDCLVPSVSAHSYSLGVATHEFKESRTSGTTWLCPGRLRSRPILRSNFQEQRGSDRNAASTSDPCPNITSESSPRSTNHAVISSLSTSTRGQDASSSSSTRTPNALAVSSLQASSSTTATISPIISSSPSSGTTSFSEALLNALNILLGVGLLSIPFAMRQGGWGALGVLALLGGVTNYTGKLLGRMQSSMCLITDSPLLPASASVASPFVRGLASYEDIGEAAFGDLGRQLITFVLFTELFGTCGLFFVLEGDTLSRLFGGDPQTFILLSGLLLVPTTWLPNLSSLARLGALGALASASVVAVLLYTFIEQGFPVAPVHSIVNWDTLPMTLGLLSFVYAGHAVFPNIQASMKEPERFPEMLDITYLIVASVCAVVGVVGYQMYGMSVQEEITLNLPDGMLSLLATSLIAINPFTKFALTMEPVAQGLEGVLGLKGATSSQPTHELSSSPISDPASSLDQPTDSATSLVHCAPRLAARTALGASAMLLAATIPAFASLMALIGSCLTLAVSVVFPSAAYLQLTRGSLSRTEYLWNWFVIFTGVSCAVAGTYTAVQSLASGSTHVL